MILGIGIDIARIDRFEAWNSYSRKQQLRIFSEQELVPLIPEKLATRFAAKEAFYKALSSALVSMGKTHKTFTLMSICPLVSVDTDGTWAVPQLVVNWDKLFVLIDTTISNHRVHLSLSHEKDYATAFVILEGERE